MKKFFALLSAFTLVLISCSSDDSSNDSTPILVTKIVETYDDNSTWTVQYEYSGTKLVKVTDDDGYSLFTYQNDLITEIKHYEASELISTETYTYDSNGRVITYIDVDNVNPDWGTKETYSYNANGSISVNYYIGTSVSQTTLNDTGTISFLNGEISQIELTSGKTTTYSYDAKNTPLLNVTGVNKITFCGFEGEGIMHNIIEEDDSEDINDMSVVFVYNNNNFPVSSTVTYDSEVITEQFYYNR
ncbi:hypothetical protein GOQ30_09070 [Flavobacterium sp. TP390]|uniref:YD repeat-containing protein n=1 Tax=Flavobacterium profundi TaxID=1774945 RepID=A0A6I4ISM4_9FLAO|nr:hypothetical protein [Flavobacterium profundi]MVO09307.1 hypothetical protein [Flavobacterium profundi]